MVAHLDRPFKLAAGQAAPVTQSFGPTEVSSEPMGYLWPDGSLTYYAAPPGGVATRLHCGIDYGIDCGTRLYAPADGVVESAGWDVTGFGNCLKLRHEALGVTTLYGHLSQFLVRPGQAVKRGAAIAVSGTTGNSTGCHLHFSVIRSSDRHYVDPAPYIMAPDVAPAVPKPAAPAAPAIPADPVHLVTFQVMTDKDRPSGLFFGPSEHLPKVQDVGSNTGLQCGAWMHGEPKLDSTTGHPDSRWYFVPALGGWISSSRVTGNAPDSAPLAA